MKVKVIIMQLLAFLLVPFFVGFFLICTPLLIEQVKMEKQVKRNVM